MPTFYAGFDCEQTRTRHAQVFLNIRMLIPSRMKHRGQLQNSGLLANPLSLFLTMKVIYMFMKMICTIGLKWQG